MNYSREELVDMIFILGESQKNCFLASRIYAERYPERRHPDKRSLQNLMERFSQTGKVEYPKPVRDKPVRTEEKELDVMLQVVENPSVSQENVADALNVSKSTVQRVLKQNRFHAYHIQFHQELFEEDFQKRVEFCNWAQAKIRLNLDFFDKVLFSDEATFHKNGFVNRHNFHYYSDHNPRIFRQIDRQHRWSINVWGGIIGDLVIGPHFFNGHLNGEMYLDFLQNELPRLCQNVPVATRNTMWLQHDGAPAHYSMQVRNHLNEAFGNRWIGRGGPTKWPPRSPDLTSLDFFLWGFVKETVYQDPPTTPEDMQQRIRNAFQTITPGILRRVARSFNTRLRLCLEENGRHIEHRF